MSYKIEPSIEDAHIITQPMVRNFSTGGGHGPERHADRGRRQDRHQEMAGSSAGRSHHHRQAAGAAARGGRAALSRHRRVRDAHALARHALHRSSCAAPIRAPQSAASIPPRPRRCRACITSSPTATRRKTNPLQTELMLQGEIVAIVAAETEDQAEDAVEAIAIDYLDLPSVHDLATAESEDAPDIREGKGNLLQMPAEQPQPSADASGALAPRRHREGFRRIRHRARVHLLFRRRPHRADAAVQRRRQMGRRQAHLLGPRPGHLSVARVSWPAGSASTRTTSASSTNGTAAPSAASGVRTAPFWGLVAHIAKVTGRPVKAMLTKAEELYHILPQAGDVRRSSRSGLPRTARSTRCATSCTWSRASSTRCRSTWRARSPRTSSSSTPPAPRIGSRSPTPTRATRPWSAATAAAPSRR